MTSLQVRIARSHEYAALGELTVAAYGSVDPSTLESDYADERRDAAGIRMLAVAADAQGRGVGEALTRACIDRARAAGRGQIVLHSTDRMTTAHRLYERLGFVRDPSIDWEGEPGLWLRGFRLRFDPV